MKSIIAITISFLLILSNLYSQVTEEWVARYNGPGNSFDYGHSIALDNSGNVYVAGRSIGSGTNEDYATIKYNSSGVQQWVQRYNGPGNYIDFANSIALDTYGNVFVSGYSYGSGTNYDYATIKYNSSGVQQWIQRYNGLGNSSDYVTSIALDTFGNVYVTGYSFGSGTNNDYATIKYNSTGVEEWVQRYNGPGNSNDRAYSIATDFSGNIYVTGYSFGSGTDYDYATIKYNSLGVQQWVKRYNGPGNNFDQAYSLSVDISRNVYVTGWSIGISTDYDYATIKYNSLGVQEWVQRYNGPGNAYDAAYSLALDDSGNAYVTGESFGDVTNRDYATIKYNSTGVLQWVQRYNGPGNFDDWANSIAIDAFGNVYVIGHSWGIVTERDYTTIKYNSLGLEDWVQRYNGPGNIWDEGRSIVLDTSGNVYDTGQSGGSGTNFDCVTIKYSTVIGIESVSNEIPSKFILYQNYPNPFNPVTNIEFSIPQNGNVKITVYDSRGKEVSNLLNQRLSAGTYKVDFDGTGYSSGIYFYKMETEGFVKTRNMVLFK